MQWLLNQVEHTKRSNTTLNRKGAIGAPWGTVATNLSMGSGTSKPVATTTNSSQKEEVKAILKKEPSDRKKVETTAWSPTVPGVDGAAVTDMEDEPMHIYDAVEGGIGKEAKEKADDGDKDDADKDDSLSEGSTSEYLMTMVIISYSF